MVDSGQSLTLPPEAASAIRNTWPKDLLTKKTRELWIIDLIKKHDLLMLRSSIFEETLKKDRIDHSSITLISFL